MMSASSLCSGMAARTAAPRRSNSGVEIGLQRRSSATTISYEPPNSVQETRGNGASIDLGADLLDQRVPVLRVVLDQLGELGGRIRHPFEAVLFEEFLRLR